MELSIAKSLVKKQTTSVGNIADRRQSFRNESKSIPESENIRLKSYLPTKVWNTTYQKRISRTIKGRTLDDSSTID